MATSFNQLLETMAEAGFFTGLLPFVIAYVLFFLTLKRVPLFAEQDEQNKFAALLSVVFAFFVARFVTENPVYQEFFIDYLGLIAVTVLGLLGLLVVLAFIGLDIAKGDDAANLWGIVLALIVITGFFVTGGADIFIPEEVEGDLGAAWEFVEYSVESGLVWLVLVLGIIWWTLKEPSDSGGSSNNWPESLFKALGDSGSE